MASGAGDIGTIIRDFREDISFIENYPLWKLTTIRIGGRCRACAIVEKEAILAELVRRLNAAGIRYYVLGQGSKVLFSSNLFKGLIIKLGEGFSYITGIGNSLLRVGAGTSLRALVNYCVKNGLASSEFLWGIPGTVGGACANNAGAFGQSFSEIIEEATIIKSDGEIKNLARRELNFGYRSCQLKEGEIITGVRLKLREEGKGAIRRRIASYSRYRIRTQPKGLSFGSCFKNPPAAPAGRLIEEAGLKGFRVGGAFVSRKHANFLLNDGRASFEDFYTLIQIIKLRVERRFGVLLEEEVRIVA